MEEKFWLTSPNAKSETSILIKIFKQTIWIWNFSNNWIFDKDLQQNLYNQMMNSKNIQTKRN